MTKVISLSDGAYATLKKLKRPGESFSDTVLRMATEQEKGSILQFAGAWKGDDIDKVFSTVMKDRKRATTRKIAF